MEERWPRRKLRIAVHPLEPCKGWPFHLERCYRQSFLIRRGVVLEELRDLEGPTSWIGAVEPRNVKFHMVHWTVRRRHLSRWRRWWRLRLLLVCFQLRHTLKKIVNFRIHGELRCCKLHNCVFEVICRHPGMSHVHHYCVMKAPMLHLFSRPKYPPKRRERKMRNSVFFIASQWVITMYLYG